MHTKSLLSVAVLVAAGEARAQTADPFGPGTGASTVLPAITVVAPRDLESEPTNAASEKRFSGETLNTRPLQRPGDILEATPGLAVTQHSGEGKANQYFLRGMNLDHGTDLAIWLDGMPVNMRTHGHGQGYADINFLIPELVQQMTVKKGPYWAEEGDFASAGSLRLAYLDRLESNVVQGTGGSFGYWRGLAAGTTAAGQRLADRCGRDRCSTTAPGTSPTPSAQVQRVPALQRRHARQRFFRHGARLYQLLAFDRPDPRPRPSPTGPSVSTAGSIRPTAATPSATRCRRAGGGATRKAAAMIEAYGIYSTLNLYNNFTYFLDNPDLGDQFQQSDKRKVLGLNASHLRRHDLLGFKSETTIGTQTRYDDIGVGLFNTFQRTPIGTVRYDQVSETSVGVYVEQHDAMDRLDEGHRLGVRGDLFTASVDSTTNAAQLGLHLGLPGQPQGRRRVRAVRQDGVLSQRAASAITATMRAAPPSRSIRPIRRSLWRRCRCWCVAGAEVGVRTPGLQGLRLVARPVRPRLQFGAAVRGRRRHDGAQPAEPARRRGVDQHTTGRARGRSFDLDLAYTRARFTDYSTRGRPHPGGADLHRAAAGFALGGRDRLVRRFAGAASARGR